MDSELFQMLGCTVLLHNGPTTIEGRLRFDGTRFSVGEHKFFYQDVEHIETDDDAFLNDEVRYQADVHIMRRRDYGICRLPYRSDYHIPTH